MIKRIRHWWQIQWFKKIYRPHGCWIRPTSSPCVEIRNTACSWTPPFYQTAFYQTLMTPLRNRVELKYGQCMSKHFTTRVFSKLNCCYHLTNDNQMGSKFCTYCDGRSAMVYANLWPDLIAGIMIKGNTSSNNFTTSLLKLMCCYQSTNGDQIRSQFCTFYDRRAVMVCTKLWADLITGTIIKANIFFTKFQLWAHQSVVKWITGPR